MTRPRVGTALPPVSLAATTGGDIRLAEVTDAVLFVFPRTGRPDRPEPDGWALIPGARGCTAESCAFRDLVADFGALGLAVLGLSTQSHAEQVEAADRLHLSYPLLSDPRADVGRALGLPTFRFEGAELYRRSTLVIRDGVIVLAEVGIADAADHPARLLESLRAGAEPSASV